MKKSICVLFVIFVVFVATEDERSVNSATLKLRPYSDVEGSVLYFDEGAFCQVSCRMESGLSQDWKLHISKTSSDAYVCSFSPLQMGSLESEHALFRAWSIDVASLIDGNSAEIITAEVWGSDGLLLQEDDYVMTENGISNGFGWRGHLLRARVEFVAT